MEILSGLKTYLAAALAVLLAIAGVLTGDLTIAQGVAAIGLATGLAGNRWVVKAIELLGDAKAPNTADPVVRMLATHLGTATTVLAAIVAHMNGEQSLIVTIGAILSALSLNFLGLGQQKAAQTVSSG